MEQTMQNWKSLPVKEKIQYACAVLLIVAGISMAFISFFMVQTIESGALMFIGECFVTAGALFGIAVFINEKIQLFNRKAAETLDEMKRMTRSS